MSRDGGNDNRNDLTRFEDTLQQAFPELRLEKLKKLKLSKPPKAGCGKRSVFRQLSAGAAARLSPWNKTKPRIKTLPEQVKTHGH